MKVLERDFDEQLKIIKELLASGRMTRFRTEYLAIHNYEQAQIFQQLEDEERTEVYHALSPKELADIFDLLESQDERVDIYFSEMSAPYAANVLAEMFSDNAVDILSQLADRELVSLYLSLMPADTARDISKLMNYLEDTAGSLMTADFISVQETYTLDEAYQHLRKQARDAETIYYVYVVDEPGRLVGVLSLRDLIINKGSKMVADVMNRRVLAVNVNDDQEEVARMVQDYNLLALPVIGFDHELLGLITVDDVVDVIEEELESDYSGLAAVDVSETHMTPLSAAKSRLPWLITLLFLGIGTSTLISRYDSLIAEVSILSAFVTLITGTAGNAGTQSLAVAVRKITNKSEEDSFFNSLGFEILTGVITGFVVGVAVIMIVYVWQGEWMLGLIIGIAMMAAIIVANLAGALIPKLMAKIGFDPAVASGPFISTLSDLTSVYIYFSIATIFLGKFLN